MSRVNVLDVMFDNITKEDAVSFALEKIISHSGDYVVTPNPEIVMEAASNPSLRSALCDAALVLPDGIGIVYGAKILRTPLEEKVPGIDFATDLMEKLSGQNGSVYLFGAKPGIAEKAAVRLTEKFTGLNIVGCADGYFTDDSGIIEDINRVKPDLLLVCLGFPKQEIWMHQNCGRLDVGLMAGLGGSLDVFAGVVERAPVKWQKLGLEWLYRLLKQPSRIGRMMRLPLFLLCVIKKRVFK